MTTTSPDVNQRHQDGTLPSDPASGTLPAAGAPSIRATVGALAREQAPVGRTMGDPHAEAALLGALLWCGSNAPDVLNVTSVKDILPSGEAFFLERHPPIFDAILALEARRVAPDPQTVHTELRGAGKDRAAGGIDYLDELVSGASTASQERARKYAQTIRDWAVRREVAQAARDVQVAACDPATPIEDLGARAQALTGVTANAGGADAQLVTTKQAITMVIRDLAQPGPDGMKTGFRSVDVATGGFYRDEVSVIGARTGEGKSAIAGQFAYGVVDQDPKAAVLYVSLEMKAKLFARRYLAGEARVEAKKIRRRTYNPTEYDRIVAASMSLAQRAVTFADVPIQTLVSVDQFAHALARREAPQGRRLAMIIIDHLGLLKPADAKDRRDRNQQIADISRGCSMLASKYSCHVMVLAQVKHAGSGAKSRAPMIEDLADSAWIARNASAVYFVHRERDEHGRWAKGVPANFVGVKARDDEQFLVKLDFDPFFVRFREHICKGPPCCDDADMPPDEPPLARAPTAPVRDWHDAKVTDDGQPYERAVPDEDGIDGRY